MKTIKHFFLSCLIVLLLAGNAAHAQYATYAEWMAAKFTPPERNDATISGPKADPEKDGVLNLVEYAFGLEPKRFDATLAPRGTFVGDHMSVTYSRPSSITDLDYTVQVSGDMINWYSGPGNTVQPDPATDDGTTTTVTVNDAVTGAARRFMRVNVSSKADLTIVTQPTASPNPVTGLTTNLSVAATDLQGDSQLTYTWSMASGPSAVAFAPNGTNASKQSVTTFSAPGTYSLQVAVTNIASNTVTTGTVEVTVNQTKHVVVTPQAAAVPYGGTANFSATVKDQFGSILPTNAMWSVTTGASIDQNGQFTAPGSGFSGPYTVTATSDGISGAAQAIITSGGLLYKYDNAYDAAGNLKRTDEGYSALPVRKVELEYDTVYRLKQEKITTGASIETTDYQYDDANNRRQTVKTSGGNTVTTTYFYESATPGQENSLNQLTKIADTTGKEVTFHYTNNGNRLDRTEAGVTTTYAYDFENRLISATQPSNALNFRANYDYRTRRVERIENGVSAKIVYSGGTSIEEYGTNPTPDVEYIRGSDYGGGVGGILYSLRSEAPSYFHYNGRGDVTTKTDAAKIINWQASYDAFGTVQPVQYGINVDRQRFSTKEADITGLVNLNQRYYDPETGTFIIRDPAGFVDGPNLYCYVNQNPWTKFDPEGLFWREAADTFLNSETIIGGVQLVRGADYKSGRGWLEAGVGVVGVVGGAADAGFNVASLGTEGVAKGGIKAAIKKVVEHVGSKEGVEKFAEAGAKKVEKTVGAESAKVAGEKAEQEVAKEAEGVVYKRTNPKTGEEYVGQAKSPERFEARQGEHDKVLGVEHEYEILGKVEPGKKLDVLEETKIREHGGLKKEGGTLANKRHQMSEKRYRQAGGTADNPN